jgi:hypothetical protein
MRTAARTQSAPFQAPSQGKQQQQKKKKPSRARQTSRCTIGWNIQWATCALPKALLLCHALVHADFVATCRAQGETTRSTGRQPRAQRHSACGSLQALAECEVRSVKREARSVRDETLQQVPAVKVWGLAHRALRKYKGNCGKLDDTTTGSCQHRMGDPARSESWGHRLTNFKPRTLHTHDLQVSRA